MAGGYNDIRKLSHEIERKKKAAEENKQNSEKKHREYLSEKMKEDKKQREAKAEQIAVITHRVRNMLIIGLVGGIAIVVAVLIKSMSREEGPKQTATLLDDEIKQLNAANDEYLPTDKFVKKLIASCQSAKEDEIIWSPAITSSMKENSGAKLNELASGEWKISKISYNEQLGFYNITCSSQENDKVYLRLTEGPGYKLQLVKVY